MLSMTRYRLLTLYSCQCALLVLLAGCGDEKGTNPADTLIGSWPAEATGRYALVVEGNACGGPFGNCAFQIYWTDTLEVCSDPMIEKFSDPRWHVETIELAGIASDSLYKVNVFLTHTIGCQTVFTVSTEEGSPPSREGWQFLMKMSSVTCGLEPELDPTLYRYTYARLGDGQCEEVH